MQRVALAHLHAYTTWATCSLPIGTIIGRHLVKVQLSLRALVANPMHHLLTAKGDVAWIHAILGVALKVPPQATKGVALHKRWLCVVVPPIFIASRTTRVMYDTLYNRSLPLVTACWALPLGSITTASKHLLGFPGILVMVPVLQLSWCFGRERVVLAYFSSSTTRAVTASRTVTYAYLPNMRASCWTVGA